MIRTMRSFYDPQYAVSLMSQVTPQGFEQAVYDLAVAIQIGKVPNLDLAKPLTLANFAEAKLAIHSYIVARFPELLASDYRRILTVSYLQFISKYDLLNQDTLDYLHRLGLAENFEFETILYSPVSLRHLLYFQPELLLNFWEELPYLQ